MWREKMQDRKMWDGQKRRMREKRTIEYAKLVCE